ncbi:hypothetical protein SAMD00019534_014400 [Acytostelium subglobosum LB1]|uniref:hypothetical protein n=1 Tax=Acytostelium subglobosum LB1 TaxID=1410327 RepID=UPI00064508D4|nr:hypothetical protein SAMD00019534_014400 [Acytostelium subglobosum LB1]GAM18265.1 hypothetical protein SAMD00019534_014400 [Acytostelium subglobosum LB1]|eukprot:XP_012758861.1 hypothetical protein SAMD00019534_014400 [Acytostelium subglobosum LB1]
MKLQVIIFVLFLVGLSSAFFPCGPSQCDRNWTCFVSGPRCFCNLGYLDRVDFNQTTVNSWKQEGVDYVQVEATVQNVGPSNLADVQVEATEYHAYGKDIWGVEWNTNGNMHFPSYVKTLTPGEHYSFGYIAKSNEPLHLYIVSITLP